jgi:hypothetical protein
MARAVIVLALLPVLGNDSIGQDAKKDQPKKESYRIHVRELEQPEQVFERPVTGLTSVLDAVGSLKPLPSKISHMDLWLIRLGADGKNQILRIDWTGMTQRGETKTNFQIFAGDRLFLQAPFPK